MVNAPSTAAAARDRPPRAGLGVLGCADADGATRALFALRERLRALGGAPRPRQRARGPGRTDYDVTLGDLVNGGVVSDGETIVTVRKNVGRVEATIHADGTVRVKGSSYASLSAAASAVSRSSQPGWEYWAVRREGGLVSLYDVRQRYPRRAQPLERRCPDVACRKMSDKPTPD